MATIGNENKVYLSDNNAYTWLSGEQNNSVSRTAQTVETSDKSSEWNTYISGAKSMTVSITVYTDNTSTAAQHKLLSAFSNGTAVKIFVGQLSGSTITEGDLMDVIITSISDTNNRGEVASRSIEIQVTGAPTHTPATA